MCVLSIFLSRYIPTRRDTAITSLIAFDCVCLRSKTTQLLSHKTFFSSESVSMWVGNTSSITKGYFYGVQITFPRCWMYRLYITIAKHNSYSAAFLLNDRALTLTQHVHLRTEGPLAEKHNYVTTHTLHTAGNDCFFTMRLQIKGPIVRCSAF